MYDTARRVALVKQRVQENTRRRQRREVISLFGFVRPAFFLVFPVFEPETQRSDRRRRGKGDDGHQHIAARVLPQQHRAEHAPLKLRLSWGKSGNNNIDHDITWTKLNLTRYVFGGTGVNGFEPAASRGNKELRWEMTSEWNVGVDFAFLNNRISGTVDLYDRRTDDLIFA